MKKIVIGLLGLGNVGKGVVNILQMNEEKFKNQLGVSFEIKKILVKNLNKERQLTLSKEILTTDPYEILHDDGIDMIVELIGGINEAYTYIKEAILNKKHIVTANKALIATHGNDLRKLAKDHQVHLKYEASVGGGIPIINTLNQGLACNEFEELVGVINGTTNYILTQMSEEGMDFDEALSLAQKNGFAEADPTSDIEGLDAAFKLSILIHQAFGLSIDPDSIPTEGITKVSKTDIDYASELGYNIKLLATAKKSHKGFEFHVHPTFIPKHHPLSSVNHEFNALFIKGNAVGELMLYGKGAGSLPTGSAVLGDMIEIAQKPLDSSIVNKHSKKTIDLSSQTISQHYIRAKVMDEPGVLGKISSTFAEYDISLESVVQRARGKDYVPLILITHKVSTEKLYKALNKIQQSSMVQEISNVMNVKNM